MVKTTPWFLRSPSFVHRAWGGRAKARAARSNRPGGAVRIFKETKASIANKLARATVPAAFFLAAMVAIGAEVVKLEDI